MSSDSYEDTDDEMVANNKLAKLAAQIALPPNPKKSAPTDESFVYRHLFNDEEYAAYLMKSEKDREADVFERLEKEDERKAREEIVKKLAKRKLQEIEREESGKTKRSISDSSSEDEEVQRKPPKKKKPETRQNKSKAATLNFSDVFGSGDDESSSSDDESSAPSSRSSRNSSPDREDEEPPKKLIEAKEDLERARITRSQLSKIVHAPFCEDVVKGAFVLIRKGRSRESKHEYIISQVLGVTQTAKVYDLESTRTNKGVRIKYGANEEVFRFNFISDSASNFTYDIYEEWREMATRQHCIPTMEHVENKQKQIKEAMDHRYTDKEVDFMVNEKSRFIKEYKPKNLSLEKVVLLNKLKAIEQDKNPREIAAIQREIDELENRIEAERMKTEHAPERKAWLEELIRRNNRDVIPFYGPSRHSHSVQQSASDEGDPFTRKREHTRVVCGTSKAFPSRESSVLKRKNEWLQAINEPPNCARPKEIRKQLTGKETFELYQGLEDIDIDLNLMHKDAARQPVQNNYNSSPYHVGDMFTRSIPTLDQPPAERPSYEDLAH